MPKIDIRLDSGVDVDLEHLTGPVPLDAGPDYVRDPAHQPTADGEWFIRADGHRKFVPRKQVKEPSRWALL